MGGVGDIGLIGDPFAIGLRGVKNEFGNSSIARKVFWTEQDLTRFVFLLLWRKLRKAGS